MGSKFVHLHVHSEYSLLDGACRIKDLIARAKELEMPALALTDHGNLFGAIDFFQKAKAAGIKPLIGCEVYTTPGRMEERNSGPGRTRDPIHHLLLLAKDATGYRNLVKLVSAAHLDGFYYKPRLDKEKLAEYSEGLICTSACMVSEIAQAVREGRMKEAEASMEAYREIFGKENFYLEVHNHGIEDERLLRETYKKWSREYGIPLVAANDVHYVRREHAVAHEVLLCIGTGSQMTDENRMRYSGPEYYLKSAEEMEALFADMHEALANTLEVAERCDVEIDFSSKFPGFDPPEGESRESYFRKLCWEGLSARYGERAEQDEEVKQRLELEIGVIEKMGFVSYFLITWDFVDYAKRTGVPVGPGRGSAAGSLVAYVLGITDLDPIRYGLLFERFLNPERVSPPDIDIDFCMNRREEVIQYVRRKYGERSVAQIVTFGTMAAKMAVRDVARVMGLSFGEASRVADQIPRELKITIRKALDNVAEFKRMYEEEETSREVIDHALSLEGVVRQTGTHAAGVVISDRDLTDYIPLTRDDHGGIQTQYAMEPLTDLGMLKMDFLGLKTLTVIQDCLDLIESSTGRRLVPSEIPLDDSKALDLLNRAQNIGVFQVESPGMRKTCLNFDIRSIEDLNALIALYRPGPMDLIDEYIRRKKGEVSFEYEHPLLESFCKETYGIMIYQEQVMKAAQVLAGYSLGDADILRRAMGKKKKEEMDKQRKVFIQGCEEQNNIPAKQAAHMFELLEKFAGYGFNKSHSAAYAVISFQTAYLKANYPVQFMAASLSSELDNTEKISLFIDEARNMGIEVLPPSVNDSELKFTVGPNQIRFGLAAIKNVGEGVVEDILRARREGGAFQSMYEFCRRLDYRHLNRKAVESLVKCGAFDCLAVSRAELFGQIDNAVGQASSLAKDRESGQALLLEMDLTEAEPPQQQQRGNGRVSDWPLRERLNYEKELLGFYVTGHPVDEFEADLRAFRTAAMGEVKELGHDTVVRVSGVILAMEVRTSQKTKRPFARIQMEDRSGRLEMVLFSDVYEKAAHLLEVGAPLVVTGRMDTSREEFIQLLPYEVLSLDEACEKGVFEIHVGLERKRCENDFLGELKEVVREYPGGAVLCLEVPGRSGGAVLMETGEAFRVSSKRDAIVRFREFCGQEQVKLRVRDMEPPPRQRRWVRKNGNGGG